MKKPLRPTPRPDTGARALPALVGHAEAALEAVLPFDRPADAALSVFFRSRPRLGGRDRAFIAEAVYGVIRRLRSLAWPEPSLAPRRLLLLHLTRHAGYGLKELTEALRPGEREWLLEHKTRAADMPPAVALDLPDWLHERLAAEWPEAELTQLGYALLNPAPLDLRVNVLKTDRETARTRLAKDGIEAAPTPYSPWGLRVKGNPAVNRTLSFQYGEIEVQDEGSQLLALLTAPRRGEMVCDFCAGAGGKTLALGALMRSTGRLYAFDVAERRLDNLKPRLKRSGLSNVHPQLIAGVNDIRVKRLAAKFDRVLVDAPCSGTGTLRRNPDLKWRQGPEALAELNAKQTAILAAAAGLVKAGGRLVYATCSLLRAENEAVVEAFLAAHPAFGLVPAREALAGLKIDLDTGAYLRLDPARHGTDGFFAAVLERRA